MFDKNLIKTHCSLNNSDEIIRFGSSLLHEQGVVTEKYCDEVIQREKIYPTGIASFVNFAICHTSPQFSIGNKVCIITLKSPVIFHDMAEKDKILNISIVYLLAFNSAQGHLKALQDIVKIMSNENIANQIVFSDTDEVYNLVTKGI